MEMPAEDFKPPYMSFQTFWNFTSELGMKPLPPRIDRSLMASKSGTDQFNLILALTSFGLIDENSHVLPLLQELTAADEEQRKSILAKMVSDNYVEPMRISAAHGTGKDLEDAFRNSYPSIGSADTRRKAITFFLHAARAAGIELECELPQDPFWIRRAGHLQAEEGCPSQVGVSTGGRKASQPCIRLAHKGKISTVSI